MQEDRKPTFAHRVEYHALRGLTWAVQRLPYRGALALGWFLAAVLHFVLRFRTREAQRRVRVVFGDRFTPAEVRGIVWRSWRNFVFGLVDMLRRRRVSPDWIRAHVEMDAGVERLVAHSESGRGAILATPHMGAWELGGRACHLMGLRFFQLAARQKNPLVDAFWHELRDVGRADDTVYRGSGALRRIIRYLREGRAMAILPDLRSREAGMAVSFLGAMANLGGGVGALARHGGVPVFPCICTRLSWTRHRFIVHAPIEPDPELDREADVRRITEAVMRIIEEAIRAHPDQWFWHNKRWVLDPLESASTAATEPTAD